MHNAKGLVNNPNSSKGIIRGNNATGKPPGIKPLKNPNKPLCLMPPLSIITKEMHARVAVTLILPVAVCPKGINPSKLQKRIKKNTVIKNGMYLGASLSPRLGVAISSRIKTARASIALANPLGTRPRLFVDIAKVMIKIRNVWSSIIIHNNFRTDCSS